MSQSPRQNQLRAKPRVPKGQRAQAGPRVQAGQANTLAIEQVAADAADALQTKLATTQPEHHPDLLHDHIAAAIREAFKQIVPTLATTFDPPPEPRLPPAPEQPAA
jgi:hypothetical protein